jgi:hypothetical protein
MRELRSIIGLCSLLALAGVSGAAPLPLLFPLQFGGPVAAGKVGWRYDKDFVSWPGEYWRGADCPPVAADPDTSRTWGSLRLGGKFDPPPQPQYFTSEAVVPLTNAIPAINGAIGYDEWSHALPVIMPYGQDQELFLLLQRTDTMLYVCLAAPSVHQARSGQVAQLYFNRGAEAFQPLGPTHLQLRATVQDPTNTKLEVFTGVSGQWTPQPLDAACAKSRAAGNSAGDGAWSYAVFEFAIPLDQLHDAKGCVLDRLNFMARISVTGGKPLPISEAPERETICWPDARASYAVSTKVSVGDRPDAWGHLRLCEGDIRPGLDVPLLTTPVRVDGQIGIKEWAQGMVTQYRFPGDQYRRLYVARDENALYLAVRTRAARGPRLAETCALYLDPSADGGLRPRADDLMYSLPLSIDACLMEHRVCDAQWGPGAAPGAVAVKGAAYPLSPYESSYEFALPLSLFAQQQAPNLAVEVSYEFPR